MNAFVRSYTSGYEQSVTSNPSCVYWSYSVGGDYSVGPFVGPYSVGGDYSVGYSVGGNSVGYSVDPIRRVLFGWLFG